MAHELLGATGELIDETQVGESPVDYWRPEKGTWPSGVELATKVQAVSPGLCQSTVYTVEFGSGADWQRTGEVSITRLWQESRYRIVGPVTGYGDFYKPHSEGRAKTTLACKGGGPVLRGSSAPPSDGYFSGRGVSANLGIEAAAFVGEALALAKAGLTAGRLRVARCSSRLSDGVRSDCDDARATVLALATDALDEVKIERCEDDATNYCVDLEFRRPIYAARTILHLRMPANGFDVDHDLPRVDRIEFESAISVY